MQRNELLDRLAALLPAQFEKLIFKLDIAYDLLSHGASQSIRAIEVLRYCEQQRRLNELVRLLAGENTQRKAPPRLSIGQLSTSAKTLIGRDTELKELDTSWDDPTRRRVVPIVAAGGLGKTTLVVHWLRRLRSMGWPGTPHVFAWSFFSQGSTDERAASTDAFIQGALRWFGDPDPVVGRPFDRADRLVQLIRKERTLLVLDGLEPLQHPPGPDEGHIKDRAFASLLRDLATESAGLVVITSRIKLADLEDFPASVVETIHLQRHSKESGIALLRSLEVKGDDAQLGEAVEEFKGHALALTLLGHLLVDFRQGDVSRYKEVGPLLHDDAQGGQARRAMAAYDRWLAPGPAHAVLRLLGLFDRPAPTSALRALAAKPEVKGLNETLVNLSDDGWNQTLRRLRKAGLVDPSEEAEAREVDAHPLVREHFGAVLKEENAAAWKEGNRRLYMWCATSAMEDLPDTAEEMAPLYSAVLHGCRAGLHQEVLDGIYWRRIRRGNEHYAATKLGAWGADLLITAAFFDQPWRRTVPTLVDGDRAWLLNEAGVTLRALGRLAEAEEPLEMGLQARVNQKNWKEAARNAANLSELRLALGRVDAAIGTAQQAVDFGDRSRDAFQGIDARTVLADALHQAGRIDEARYLFVEAETIQHEGQPEFPHLSHELHGYRFCELLLTQNDLDAVLRQVEQSVSSKERSLLSIGLEHLCRGRAYFASVAGGGADSATPTGYHIDEAVARLREAGWQTYLATGLLHRATVSRYKREYARAAVDLAEALRIATRGHMRLHEADAYLERSRLLLAQRGPAAARADCDVARKIIAETGYGRRAGEVGELVRLLGVVSD